MLRLYGNIKHTILYKRLEHPQSLVSTVGGGDPGSRSPQVPARGYYI